MAPRARRTPRITLEEQAKRVAALLRGQERERALARASTLRARLARRIDRAREPEETVSLALLLTRLEPQSAERRRAMAAIDAHAADLGVTPLAWEASAAMCELFWAEGQRERCLDAAERTREIAGALGDPKLRARAELAWARWAVNSSQIADARDAAERAIALVQGDDRALEARALLVLTIADSLAGRPALRSARRAVLLASELPDRELEVASLAVLGGVLVERGILDEAKTVLQRAIELARAIGAHQQECRASIHLALTELDRGHALQAGVAVARANEIADALGERATRGMARGIQGVLHLVRGHTSAASRALSESEILLEEVGNRYTRGIIVGFQAAAEALSGRPHEAAVIYETARTTLGDGGPDVFVARTLAVIERVIAFAGDRLPSSAMAAELERISPSTDPPPASTTLRIALRWARALASAGHAPEHVPVSEARSGLVVGPAAAWFRVEGGHPVRLRARPTLKRLLLRLVEERVAAPGSTVANDELIGAVWPSDARLPRALLRNRLYVAIRKLRTLGLGELVVRGEDGYRLRAEVPFELDHAPDGFHSPPAKQATGRVVARERRGA
jgi:tetratricopeptide (TPR) repeat protein